MAIASFFGPRSIQTTRETALWHAEKMRLGPGNMIVMSQVDNEVSEKQIPFECAYLPTQCIMNETLHFVHYKCTCCKWHM